MQARTVMTDNPNSMTNTTAFDQIADAARWVAWRDETRKGKPTKVPYCPEGGERAKPNDPSTWGTRTQARDRAEQLRNGKGNSGIGIILGDLGTGAHLIGIDFDSCIDEHGCLALWAEKILVWLHTYAERSPSGTGLKVFFRCKSEYVRPFLDLLGVDPDKWGTKRSVGEDTREHGPAVEVYCSHRYFAVTGELWLGKPDSVELLDWPALEQLARAIPANGGGKPNGRDNTRSAVAFRRGLDLQRAGKTFDEFCEALRTDPDPEIVAWVGEKGEANGMRELHRIWDNAASADASEEQKAQSPQRGREAHQEAHQDQEATASVARWVNKINNV
jgi:putative DNA primase/helicase